jgi:hypothetical protein
MLLDLKIKTPALRIMDKDKALVVNCLEAISKGRTI